MHVFIVNRDSMIISDEEKQRHIDLFDCVTKAIQGVCHKTNQVHVWEMIIKNNLALTDY